MSDQFWQPMNPVYLQQRQKGQREEDFNSALGKSQDSINQNFSTLYNGGAEHEARLAAIEEWAKQFRLKSKQTADEPPNETQ